MFRRGADMEKAEGASRHRERRQNLEPAWRPRLSPTAASVFPCLLTPLSIKVLPLAVKST